MLILGIETSCDETAIGLVEEGKRILANTIFSQEDIHREFGGVVPELASRSHLQKIDLVIKKGLKVAKVGLEDVEGIAVTQGPGLVGSLLVGIEVAKALSFTLKVPIVGINHGEAHLYANFLVREIDYPFIGLVVSGGHTALVEAREPEKYLLLGQTRDDAAGEAFDKVAKILGLGYPGGPIIDRLSQKGEEMKGKFPRPYLKGNDDFSFSGLKTAVLRYVKSLTPDQQEKEAPSIAREFQQAVIDVLVTKTLNAAERRSITRVLLAGGVASNSALREQIVREARRRNIEVYVPPPSLCTDNGAMIAGLGFWKIKGGRRNSLSLDAQPNLSW